MSTKADQFASKLSHLKDFLQHFVVEETSNTGNNYNGLINTVNYFNKVILNLQKDQHLSSSSLLWLSTVAPENSGVVYLNATNATNHRLSTMYITAYPSYNFNSLYDVIITFLKHLPSLHHNKDLCEILLECLCHVFVLTSDEISADLPLFIAELIPGYDASLHKLVVSVLCQNIIPLCFGGHLFNKGTSRFDIVAAMLAINFEFVTNTQLQIMMFETLMVFKPDLWKDMLNVIAYAAPSVKMIAVQYIFHYWPNLYGFDQVLHQRDNSYAGSTVNCQHMDCPSEQRSVATTVVLDPVLAAKFGRKTAPLYLCEECQNRSWSSQVAICYYQILLSKETISYVCENKNCLSQQKTAVMTVCGMQKQPKSNAIYSKFGGIGKQWTRYCSECYNNICKLLPNHKLMVQKTPPTLDLKLGSEEKSVIVNSIVSLFMDSNLPLFDNPPKNVCSEKKSPKCAKTFFFSKEEFESSTSTLPVYDRDSCLIDTMDALCSVCSDNLWNGNSLALSQFAIWLLFKHCPVTDKIDKEAYNSLLTALLKWCVSVTYLPNDDLGNYLENWKYKMIKLWLSELLKKHFHFANIFLPHSEQNQIEGLLTLCQYYEKNLNLLLCLTTYSVVQLDLWNYLMPAWLGVLHTNYEKIMESALIKDLLNKLFDCELSPLPFPSSKVFDFIEHEFQKGTDTNIITGLSWLQFLSEYEILIPFNTLSKLFEESIEYFQKKEVDTLTTEPVKEDDNKVSTILKCFVSLLHIAHTQMVLQEITLDSVKAMLWRKPMVTSVQKMLSWLTEQDKQFLCGKYEDDEILGGEAGQGTETSHSEEVEPEFAMMFSDSLLTIFYECMEDVLDLVLDHHCKFKEGDRRQRDVIDIGLDIHTMFLLMNNLLELLGNEDEPSIQYLIISSLQLVSETCQFLSSAKTRSTTEYEANCCELITRAWTTVCCRYHSLFIRMSEILIQNLHYPAANSSYMTTVKTLLDHEDWDIRYDIVNRVAIFLSCVDVELVEEYPSISQAIAMNVCHLVTRLDDLSLQVQIKSDHVFTVLSEENIKGICECLQLEFVHSPSDRSKIISCVTILRRLFPELHLFSHFYSSCLAFLSGWNRFGYQTPANFHYDEFGNSATTELASRKKQERSVMHQLTRSICTYMTDYSIAELTSSQEKDFSNLLKNIFKHFGYNDQVWYFTAKPDDVRTTVGFSAFVLALPKILDGNRELTDRILPMSISLLHYSTFPGMSAMHNPHSKPLSLSMLTPALQESWLVSLLLILYKCKLVEFTHLKQLSQLVSVCLNTLSAEIHHCESEIVLGMPTSTTSDFPEASVSEEDIKISSGLPPYSSLYSPKTFMRHKRNRQSIATCTAPRVLGSSCKSTSNVLSAIIESQSRMMARSNTSVCSETESNDMAFNHLFKGEDFLDKDDISMSSGSSLPHDFREQALTLLNKTKAMAFKTVHIQNTRCYKCGAILESYSPTVMSLCLVNLCQYMKIFKESATPLLPHILIKIVSLSGFLLEMGKLSDTLPSSSGLTTLSAHSFATVSRVAKQSMRCILHQYTDNLIFPKLFLLKIEDSSFLPLLASCLNEYQDLNAMDAAKFVLEGVSNEIFQISKQEFSNLIANLSTYFQCLSSDYSSTQWQQVCTSFTIFCSKLSTKDLNDANGIFKLTIVFLKSNCSTNSKLVLLEAISKHLSTIIQYCTFSVPSLHTLCSVSSKSFTKPRDKMFFTRCVISELMSVLKLKVQPCDRNIMIVLQVLLVDINSCLNPSAYAYLDENLFMIQKQPTMITQVTFECLKTYISDCLEIIADCEFLKNLKVNLCPDKQLIGDVCIADVKVSLAQIMCVEIHQSQSHQRTMQTLLPWLYETPSIVNQGPRDYADSVSRVRQLSWLLLGSLTHLALKRDHLEADWQPIPIESSSHLSSIMQIILTSFPIQYKEGLVSITSLFYGLIFCQLWTIYCDEITVHSQSATGNQGFSTEQYSASTHVMEFWSRVIPSIILLLKHGGAVSEMIHIHIMSIIKCLKQHNSTVLFRLNSLGKLMLDNSDCSRLHHCRSNLEEMFEVCSSLTMGSSQQYESSESKSSNNLLAIVDELKARLTHVEMNGLGQTDIFVI